MDINGKGCGHGGSAEGRTGLVTALARKEGRASQPSREAVLQPGAQRAAQSSCATPRLPRSAPCTAQVDPTSLITACTAVCARL